MLAYVASQLLRGAGLLALLTLGLIAVAWAKLTGRRQD